ncbi:MAG: hypothetical protein AB1752_06060, partial [Candidatus Zixiibacteriota bacterium]
MQATLRQMGVKHNIELLKTGLNRPPTSAFPFDFHHLMDADQYYPLTITPVAGSGTSGITAGSPGGGP